jgi:hypothetical protein
MRACTKCPEKHSGAEDVLQRSLSCTEVKHFWIAVRKAHKRRFGHLAQVVTNEAGDRICDVCNRNLEPEIGNEEVRLGHQETEA